MREGARAAGACRDAPCRTMAPALQVAARVPWAAAAAHGCENGKREGEGVASGTFPFLHLELDARCRRHLAHHPIGAATSPRSSDAQRCTTPHAPGAPIRWGPRDISDRAQNQPLRRQNACAHVKRSGRERRRGSQAIHARGRIRRSVFRIDAACRNQRAVRIDCAQLRN